MAIDFRLNEKSEQDVHDQAVELVKKKLLEKESEYQRLLTKLDCSGGDWKNLLVKSRLFINSFNKQLRFLALPVLEGLHG